MHLRIYHDLDDARATVLRRRLVDDVTLPDEIQACIRRVFGEDLDPDTVVRRIIQAVRSEGDQAIRQFARAFDGQDLTSLEVPPDDLERAWSSLPIATRAALELAAARIRAFHERAMPRGWIEFDHDSLFGQIFRPISRVGIYAPGGRAAYPSTVLMAAVPARVAGVESLVLCTPPGPTGMPNPAILAAAKVAGVDRVFRVGGAPAIAALAHGTETLPRVDKIVGPGNVFVALAKRQVFGVVGIDQIAGPTETVLIADESAAPDALAADLIAQAEHDPMATALLLTNRHDVAAATAIAVERQIADQPRREIIAQSLQANGGAVVTPSIDVAIDLANEFAPEHLCLMVRDPWALLPRVRNAGGIFLGERSLEALGDYTAGPSHVMPTAGTARFASPLNVLDFLKISSLFDVSPELFQRIAPATVTLAEIEGLLGHAAAVRQRQRGDLE